MTWGTVQPMTWDWWSTYGDEAWVILSDEYERTGTVGGIDVTALQADSASV